MTKFFVKWRVDLSRSALSPKEAVQLGLKLGDAVKAEMSSGKVTEWGSFCNGKDGYCIIEGTEQDVVSTMYKYISNVSYEVYPVHGVDDSIAAMKEALGAMQA